MLQELRLNAALRENVLGARKGTRLHVRPCIRRDTARTGQLIVRELASHAYTPALAGKLDPARIWVDEHGVIYHGQKNRIGRYLPSGKADPYFQNGALRFDRFGFDAVNVAVWHDVAEIGLRFLFCPSRHAAIQNAQAAQHAPQRRYMLPPLPFMPTH